MIDRTPRPCGDCGAEPGQLHNPGCDVERCRRCGHQAIGCDCVYEVNGMDPYNLEEDHPDIYTNGATDEMYAVFDQQFPRRVPWTGIWPGVVECQEYGLYAQMIPGKMGWHPCDRDDPDATDATEDLNTLAMVGRWDAERQRMVIPEKMLESLRRRRG